MNPIPVFSLRENGDRVIRLTDAQGVVQRLSGAMKNEMAVRGLPLEWSPDSALSIAEEFLKLK